MVLFSNIVSVSFTGSEYVGAKVGKKVQGRIGKALLELGGNNGSVVMPDADLSLAVPAVFFGAVGTAGQRCTTTRRLFLHRDIAPKFLDALKKAYSKVPMGDPLVSSTLLGPLHTHKSVQNYHRAILHLHDVGAEVLAGGKTLELKDFEGGNFVQPTLAIPPSPHLDLWKKEVFAPILNVAIFDELDQAIEWHNSVPQGLSSSIWTRDIRNIGRFLGPAGSDCGIVNVSSFTRPTRSLCLPET
jgi:aldehyde dehydrogenase family 7 protein A1